jgi:hypothetical protein
MWHWPVGLEEWACAFIAVTVYALMVVFCAGFWFVIFRVIFNMIAPP